MSFNFEDFSDSSSANQSKIACPLGTKCRHTTEAECDEYRQKLLEAEHKKDCDDFKIDGVCPHFGNHQKGLPFTARWKGMSPAEFLIWSRGGKRDA